MYTDVVVGMDGTDAAHDALAAAQTLTPGSIRLSLTHVRVLARSAVQGRDIALAPPSREDSIQLPSAEREPGVAPTEILIVLAVDVASGLQDVAESRGVDLLVVGSCRRAALGRVLIGDDARAVLRRAPCAVAVAPRGYRKRAKTVEVIGVAYDGSAQGDVALARARALSDQTGARVVARHVIALKAHSVRGLAAPVVPDAEEEMARARERLGYLGDAEVSVVVGASGEQLAAFSETVDVLICGSRSSGIVRRVALGRTSDYLLRHCACPLIVTTAAAQEPAVSVAPDRLAVA
jgi:nucleotide-binding universal stress UspA family protein